ncbi:MAG: hypothetical protein IT328_12050 [Caldilineaceae bacterium]|nr:hypothetical protein [Caldilineaceae bacterium]
MYRHLTTLLLLLSLLIAACAPVVAPATSTQPAAPTAEATQEPTEEVEVEATAATTTEVTSTEVTTTEEVTATESVTSEVESSSVQALLTWEGEIDGACHTLTIQANGEAAVTLCGDAPTNTTTLDAQTGEWAAIQEHFGMIDAETPAGKITFGGQGSAEGDLWAQALATWASFTAMELNTGQTSASARTILAWKVTDTAEHSGQCSHLVVLAYGYAYANLIPCDGNGPSTQIAAGWLTDSELATLYQWVATGARVEGDAGYLDVQGSEPVSPEEITTWAKAIYARMIQ